MRPAVLIADDSAPIRRVAEAALKPLNIELFLAPDSDEALARMTSTHIDLVLCDLHLPEGGAKGVIDAISRRGLQIPVVVLMSPLDDFDVARGRRVGAAGVFIKPFDPIALREVVARHCPQAFEGASQAPAPPDPGSVAMERIRQEVLQVKPGLGGGRASHGGEHASLEAAVEGEIHRLFGGDGLDPRLISIISEVVRAELVRVLPQVVREVVRERIAEIEAEAMGKKR